MVNNWLTGAQLRAARGLLALTAEQLAEEAGLSLRTIRRAEQDHGPLQVKADTESKIATVLKARGAILLSGKVGGEGVKLRRAPIPRFGK